MNQLNPFAIISLLIAVSGYATTIVFFIYAKAKIHRIWTLFNFCVANWGLFNFLASTTPDASWAYFYWLTSTSFALFITIAFTHFISYFCNYSNPFLIRVTYIYGIIVLLLICLSKGSIAFYGVKFLYKSFNYLQIKLLPWLIIYSFWLLLLFWCHFKLWQYSKTIKTPNSNNFIFILIISTMGFSGGLSTIFPMIGFYNFYPITIILTLIYELGASYTIFKRDFFQVDLVIQKSTVYSILVTVLTLFYLVLIFITDQFLQNNWQLYNYSTRFLGLVIISLIFNPLRNQIQTTIDNVLFKATPAQLSEQNELLRQEVVKTDKFKTVSTLASGIAHEIKNPLTALKTFFEYYPAKKNDPDFVEKFHRLCSAEVDRIEQIVQELLEFAKPSALTLKEVNIQKIIEHGLNLTSSELSKHNVKVETHFTPNLPTIMADGNKILQVLINLILNAKDALVSGGTLTVATTSSDHNIILTITDTGCGIAPKDLTKIFDPFYSTKEKGTGLGLSIVKGIIEDHGGKITVKSQVGKGTEFTITFLSSQRMLGSGDNKSG